MTLKTWFIKRKKKSINWTSTKFKTFALWKTANSMEWQAAEWEKISVNHINDKGLISVIHEEFSKLLLSKKNTTQWWKGVSYWYNNLQGSQGHHAEWKKYLRWHTSLLIHIYIYMYIYTHTCVYIFHIYTYIHTSLLFHTHTHTLNILKMMKLQSWRTD